jgi:Tfp pilus assembly protein FimT
MRCFLILDMRFPDIKSDGFTLAELLVSVGVLMIISVSVIGDITRTRYQEELNSTARSLVASLRDVQSMALSASSIKICTPSAGVTAVCEFKQTQCAGAACSSTVSPSVFGITLQNGANQFSTFADVNGTANYREDATGKETMQTIPFAKANPSVAFVTVTALATDLGSVASSTVTFDRQRGSMRINPCLVAPCSPAEATTLSITLTHARTGKTKVVYLNAVTGKVEIQ